MTRIIDVYLLNKLSVLPQIIMTLIIIYKVKHIIYYTVGLC